MQNCAVAVLVDVRLLAPVAGLADDLLARAVPALVAGLALEVVTGVLVGAREGSEVGVVLAVADLAQVLVDAVGVVVAVRLRHRRGRRRLRVPVG